jgi:hypothetical protein
VASVADCGLKMQLAPWGKPVHAKLTDCLNPFSGVTVMVIVPVPPFVTFMLEVLMESV